MKTIAILGVGSTYFTKGIVESLVQYGGQWDIRMVDIDENCLDIALNLGKRLVDKYQADVRISGSLDRCDVLAGVDAVVSTIGVGGRRAWEKDVFMFHQFGIYQSTGDTFGAGGISRGIRTIPVLLEVAKDMERLCPDALLVNFTNPMTVNCWALNKITKVKAVGLCYGATYYQHYLSQLIGVPFEETWCKAVGVNHFTWITEFTHHNVNAWPMVHETLRRNPDEKKKNPLTWELFETFGAYPTVGDGHICEFIPGYQAEGAYYGKTFGIDAGHNFKKYASHWDDVFEDMAAQAYGRKPLEVIEDNKHGVTFRDEDLFRDVLLAALGETGGVERTINLPNRGLVSNLPADAVLEVTTLVNGSGFHPYAFGELPCGINAIVQRIAASQALTVEASIQGDRNLVIQALLVDSVALNRGMAEKIADCILTEHKAYLPHFFK